MALPRGIRNNNPLNIRKAKGQTWQGERKIQSDTQFVEFVSIEYGIRAGFKILRNYITGYNGRSEKFNTIEKIISRWAPSVENATEAYIRYVSDKVGISRDTAISFYDLQTMISLVQAMIEVECGLKIDRSVILHGHDLIYE